MNKIEPNMYVRTLFGIKKIDHINNKKTVWKYLYKINDDNEYYALSDNDVIKASHNIIDLIEVGDYVNGSEVLDFENKYIKENDEFVRFGVITENCYLENTDSWIIEKDIKSIVTKEQFSSMEYRLGE